MGVSWRSWPNIFNFLSLCATAVVAQELRLEPVSATVLKGSEVQFNATVQGKWEVMTWHVSSFLVLTVTLSSSNNVTSSSEQFSAKLCSGSDTSCVQFIIRNVTRSQSGPVVCSVLGMFGSKTANLTVQESGTVSITGGGMRVVEHQQVEFQCLTSGWYPEPLVGWSLNGEPVNSSLYNTSSTADVDSFNSSSVLNFQAVSHTTVECWATLTTLSKPISSSVSLVVDPKPTDWTVLIAVVVSFSSFALLVLLIIGIIFCYKRRKEKQPNYQDEMTRRVRSQSEMSGTNTTGQKQGQVNEGYVSEGQTSSDLSDGGFYQINGSGTFEMPDVVNSVRSGNVSRGEDLGYKKHRHVTIV